MTHAEAREILRRAWTRVHGSPPSEGALTLAQAIANLETGYGRAGQFGALAARGLYNWGALERQRLEDGTCPPGTEPGSDVGQVCFYVFRSDEDAAVAFLRTLTAAGGRNADRARATLGALQGGDAAAVAGAMRTPPAYYEGPPGSEAEKQAAYAHAIRSSIAAAGNREPSAGGTPAARTTSAAVPVVIALAALGAFGLWFYREGGFVALGRAVA